MQAIGVLLRRDSQTDGGRHIAYVNNRREFWTRHTQQHMGTPGPTYKRIEFRYAPWIERVGEVTCIA